MIKEFKAQSKTDQVSEYVKSLIDNDVLKPGEQLIPESQLAKKLGISLITVRRGLDQLVKRNLIYRVQGKGTFAGPPAVEKTLNINLVYPNNPDATPDNPFLGQVLNGINEFLTGKSIRLALSPIPPSSSFAEVLEDTQWRSFLKEGAIFTNYRISDEDSKQIKKHDIPLVNIGSCPDSTGLFSVDVDHEMGGYMATTHFIKHGRKRILILGNSKRYIYTADILKGYKKALAENGIELDESLIYDHPVNEEVDGFELMDSMLEKFEFDAVMSFGSPETISAVKCLCSKGKRIPEDIAFISYNDFPIVSEFSNPPLTAIAQPVKELGRYAAELLLDIKNGKLLKSTAGKKVLLNPELIVRGSCGAS